MDYFWINDKRFNFFWNHYKQNFYLTREDFYSNKISNNFYQRSYNEQSNFIYLASLANKAAHLATQSSMELVTIRPTSSKKREPSLNKKSLSGSKSNKKAKIEFEINEDIIKFYEQSILYKREKKEEEKRNLKMLAEGKATNYVVGEQVKPINFLSTNKAPLERVGLKREEALRLLYGGDTFKIQMLEANLQMIYDKNYDLYQPFYWPSLPLKL